MIVQLGKNEEALMYEATCGGPAPLEHKVAAMLNVGWITAAQARDLLSQAAYWNAQYDRYRIQYPGLHVVVSNHTEFVALDPGEAELAALARFPNNMFYVGYIPVQ